MYYVKFVIELYIVIRKNGNKKTLYDITNIKRIDQNRGTSANASSTSLVNSSVGNVPQSNTNVNTSSTKYSMQLNENNDIKEKARQYVLLKQQREELREKINKGGLSPKEYHNIKKNWT